MTASPPFTAGVPELLVLRLLQNREMYGYEIVAAIADATGQVVAPKEGVIYPCSILWKRTACSGPRRGRRMVGPGFITP